MTLQLRPPENMSAGCRLCPTCNFSKLCGQRLTVSGANNVGGIAGYAAGTVKDVQTSEDVTVSGTEIIGGIVGYAVNASVSGCVNQAAVESPGNYVGGIIEDSSSPQIFRMSKRWNG